MERSCTRNLSIPLKDFGGIKSKHTQEKQTAQNNQIQDRKQSKRKGTIKQSSESQAGYVKKINKTDKPLAKLMKRQTDSIQMKNIRNEKGYRTTNIEEIDRIIKCYFKCEYYTKLRI